MKPKEFLEYIGASPGATKDDHPRARRARRALLTAITGDSGANMPADSELHALITQFKALSPRVARTALSRARQAADNGVNPIADYDQLAEWLTPAEFGAALPGGGRSRSAVYNWINRDAKIPADSVLRVGASQLKIRKTELLRFCEWRNL